MLHASEFRQASNLETMATVNATLQRQYQRQKRLMRRRRESLFYMLVAGANKRPTTARTRIMVVVYGGIFLLATITCLGISILLVRWLSGPPPQTIAATHPMASMMMTREIEEPPSVITKSSSSSSSILPGSTAGWVQQHLLRSHRRKLVWTCAGGGCGGIGDRLLGILQGFCMAVCLDREFVVDWRDDSVVFSSSSGFQPPEVLLVALDDRQSTLLQNLDGILGVDTEVVGIKTNLWMGPAIVQSYSCWDSSFVLDDTAVLKTILQSLFTVSSNVKRLAKQIKEASGLGEHQPYIGVHLRTGLLDEKRNHFSQQDTNWTSFLECGFDHCCENDKTLPLFVVSDNNPLKRSLDPQFQSTGRFYTSTVNETQLVHYAKTSDGGTSQSIAWAEWLILAESKCVLPTYQSKYSQSASLFSGCAIDTCSSKGRT